MKKTIFISHPIGGDVDNNIKKVLKICARVHTKSIIPVLPYLVSLQYLNDEIIEDKRLGIAANLECFRRGYVDEVWLYGDRISPGMKEEIALARKLGIPIIAKTPQTKRTLQNELRNTNLY